MSGREASEARRARALLLLLAALALAGCAALLRGAHLYCPLYELTGLYCPGCGSGRAARALLHGELGAALSCNLMATLLAPLGALLLGRELLRRAFPRLGLRPLRLPAWLWAALPAALLAFTILRNLPACAFLAP